MRARLDIPTMKTLIDSKSQSIANKARFLESISHFFSGSALINNKLSDALIRCIDRLGRATPPNEDGRNGNDDKYHCDDHTVTQDAMSAPPSLTLLLTAPTSQLTPTQRCLGLRFDNWLKVKLHEIVRYLK